MRSRIFTCDQREKKSSINSMANSRALPKFLQEENEEALSQECKQLLSSLPKEKGLISNLYQYRGFWFTSKVIQAAMSCQRHFQAQDSDIILATIPKSGTTWLKALVYTTLRRKSFPTGGAATHCHPLLSNNPHDLVPFLELNLFLDGRLPDLSTFDSPRLFSTHLPFACLPESVKSSNCKVIYLCRNPKDTFVSLWHFTNLIGPGESGTNNSLEDHVDRFCRGVNLSGPFWDNMLGYWNESLERSEKVLFMKYEEMKENPGGQLTRLAQFLGCQFSSEEEATGVVDEILQLCSFNSLGNMEINKSGTTLGIDCGAFFRRGRVGDWKNFLTDKVADKIDRITQEKLHPSGLTFV